MKYDFNKFVTTELGKTIFENKYKQKGEDFDQWLQRVSGGNEEIARLIAERKFLFAGRTLSNRGMDNGSLSNCYSIGYLPDDFNGILETNKEMGLTYKAQGGQGVSLSLIRPKGASIGNRYTSDGIVPFMKLLDTTTSITSQAGSRKGALMISLSAWHPEVSTFIKIKEDENAINKANLSVEADNDFMHNVIYEKVVEDRVMEGKTWKCEYKVDPRAIFRQIAESAWKSAEPGILFTDRLRNYHIMQHHPEYKIITTNPCGEQPLPKHGACNISSINISEYMINEFTDDATVDFKTLAKDITTIVRAMDDVLEENLPHHALEEQREVARNYRNIGIGVMGIADAMIKMNMEYGSKESIDFIEFLMRFMFRNAMFASSSLAIERGAFPKYCECIFDSDIVKQNFTEAEIERLKLTGIRNCSLLSIAPTGSIGTMLDVSTGIEPLFALKYTRKTESLMGEDAYFDVFPSIVQKYMDLKGITFDELPSFFISSERIDPINRVRVQAAAQNSVDTAISSTVNLPESATVEDIEEIYRQAWFHGLKGITVYRDGSRTPILSRESASVNEEKVIKVRPKSLVAEIHTVTNKGVRYNVFVGLLDDKPYEIFCQKEIAGIDLSALSEFLIIKEGKGKYVFSAANGGIKIMLQENTAEERSHAILISMLLRHNVDLGSIIKTAKKIDDNISSFSSAICRVLSKYIKDGKTSEECPECGGTIAMTGGCKSCTNCGYSKCG